jgi:hypothetical protein
MTDRLSPERDRAIPAIELTGVFACVLLGDGVIRPRHLRRTDHPTRTGRE